MDSFELNKIAGAVLTAALLIFGGKTVLEIAEGGHKPAKPGYVLPVTAAPAGGVAVAGPVFSFAKVAELLPKANVGNGADVFKKCTACHTPEKAGANRVGPNLYGIVERDVAKHAGFAYSPAMTAKGGKWTWEGLAAYLNDPRGNIPGNKMAFAGVTDTTDLADVLAYLRTLADTPADLPK